MFVALGFFEGVRQASEPAQGHRLGLVLPLHVAGGDISLVGVARDALIDRSLTSPRKSQLELLPELHRFRNTVAV